MSRPMRVLMVSEPGEYGVLIYVRDLIRFLHEHHPEVTVDYAYSSRRGSEALKMLVAEVECRGGKTFDMQVGNAPEAGDWRALQGIRKMIREGRPAIIHAHSSKAGALMRLNACAGSPPVLYSPHGYYGMSRRGGRKEQFFNLVERVLGRIGRTHFVSRYEETFAAEKLGVTGSLIHTGIDLSRFHLVSPEEKREARAALGLPLEGRILATLGRDAFEKNYTPLYQVLANILPGANWWFAHAGVKPGELDFHLDEEGRKRVFTFPYLQTPGLLLKAADGFVMTSRSEAFGLAALEAACCGLPLILTETSGLLMVREYGFEGVRWVPNPAEVSSITKELGAALCDWAVKPFTEEERVAQFQRAATHFNAKVQFEKLLDLYRNVITG